MMKFSFLIVCGMAFSEIAMADERKDGGEDTFAVIMSTKHDFSETSINGQMRAPDGFFLRGRETQRMSQMVRLRSNFNKRVRDSRSGLKAMHR